MSASCMPTMNFDNVVAAKKALDGAFGTVGPGPAFPVTNILLHFKHPALCPCVTYGMHITDEHGQYYQCTICEGTHLHPFPETEFYSINVQELLEKYNNFNALVAPSKTIIYKDTH